MKKFIIIFAVLLSGSVLCASETAPEIEEIYIFQCGSLAETLKVLKMESRDLSDSDIKELISARKNNLAIIREGASAIKKLIVEGSRNDTGSIGALLACGLVSQISEKVKERGCLDLETNEVVKDGPGFEVCKEIISSVKK